MPMNSDIIWQPIYKMFWSSRGVFIKLFLGDVSIKFVLYQIDRSLFP